MRLELTDKNKPKECLTIKGGTARGQVVVQIDGVSREVDAAELSRAVNVARNTPEAKS
jgi:hypothetical protein